MKKVIILLGIFISTIIGHATPTVKTNKMVYSTNKPITVSVTHMLGDSTDWIAIYPKGSTNEWKNVLRWSWTDGFTDGSKTFEGLAVGEYEARVFFENSFTLEGSSSFSVEGNVDELNITTSKELYTSNEQIVVNFENMLGDSTDWIAIYPKGSTNEWKNVLRWSWTKGVKTGSFTFDALPKGEYEARAFFENSFNLEKASSFSVSDVPVDKDAFIATWEIGASKKLQLATVERYNYNFNVDWGDGTTNQNITSTIIHNYKTEGNYTIRITGVYPQPTHLCYLGFNQMGQRIGYQNLVSIDQWGTQKWKSMHSAFANCKDFNIINDPKAPDLSIVTTMQYMFTDAFKFNQPIGHWDVSNITNMDSMFFNASSFNQQLSVWNVSNVIYMTGMFRNASLFNQDLSAWDIKSIIRNGITLNGSSFSSENYDKLLIAWSQLNVHNDVYISATDTQYSQRALNARQILIDTYNWHITDAGEI